MSEISRSPSEGHRAVVVSLLVVAMLGIAARFALSAVSIGTVDAIAWEEFGRGVNERGVIAMYASDARFNHPPAMGLWAGAAQRISAATSLRFAPIFRVPAVLSEVIVCGLLWSIWRQRSRPLAALVVALFAWNIDAILVSAYHGNTDSIYAMLVLLACWLMQEKRAYFFGGLALAAAINVKLIPVIFVVPLLAAFRGRGAWMSILKFMLALAVGALPFVPVILRSGPSFAKNSIAYSSILTDWGFPFLLMEAARRPMLSAIVGAFADRFHDVGRWVMLGAIVLWSLYARRRNDTTSDDPYRNSAITAALFLIFASGFGTQYTIIVVPLLMATAPLAGTVYGALAGIFLFLNYLAGWNGGLPIQNYAASGLPIPGAPFGLLAWAMLVGFVWNEIQRLRGAAR